MGVILLVKSLIEKIKYQFKKAIVLNLRTHHKNSNFS
jgi:hypothetical protein